MTPLSSPMGDKQELAILESKRVLCSRMNNRLPIFRLPTEILAMVFKNLEDDQRFDESASSDVPAGVVSADCSVAYALERMCVQRAGHLWTRIVLVMYQKPAPPRRCLNPIISQAPRLRSVELTCLRIDWTADVFSGIRTLSIRDPGPHSFSTLSRLLSALRRMPALEHLSLERILIDDDGTMLCRTVSLPHHQVHARHPQ